MKLSVKVLKKTGKGGVKGVGQLAIVFFLICFKRVNEGVVMSEKKNDYKKTINIKEVLENSYEGKAPNYIHKIVAFVVKRIPFNTIIWM